MAKKRNPPKKSLAKTLASQPKTGKPTAPDPRLDLLYRQIHEILTAARNRAWHAVNTVMVGAYWEVGRVIVEDEQAGRERAGYGKRLLEGLAARLQTEFGKGYDPSNLRNMRAFFLTYPIRDALRHDLSWTHYRLLLRVDNSDARAFYEAEAVNARWSTRELERQINSLLFDRLSLSRDKAGVSALASKGHEITQPSDLVKDPMVLEFTELRQDERFRESDLEQALIAKEGEEERGGGGADADVRQLLPARADGPGREPAHRDRALHGQERGGGPLRAAGGKHPDLRVAVQAPSADRGGTGGRAPARAPTD